jgi:glutamate formiminotransferase / 5-formyltetrahydrofolate cyclo-ligase
VFECVLNLSEGRRADVLDELARASGTSLADRHADQYHHRSVFTLINERSALTRDVRRLISASLERLDLADHDGVHPRFGVVDVVPFVALDKTRAAEACAMRDETARWLAATYEVPCFYYGPLANGSQRTLPEVRRHAFSSLAPDVGPASAHPRWGASAVGCREILVAWNLWLDGVSLEDARAIAASLRRPALRTLAFRVGDNVQVSCNLVDVAALRLSQVYDEVAARLPPGGRIARAELVGLAPTSLVDAEDPARRDQLDLSRERTIEAQA